MANTPQTYSVKFRSLTPEKLAAIIVNEGDYHEDAVKAARLELTARMLPAEELDRVYDLAKKESEIPKHTDVELTSWQKELKKQEENKKSSKSIWWRTTSLKIVFAYLLYSLGRSIRIAISDYSIITDISTSTLDIAPYLLAPLLLLIIIVLGIKGYKSSWWGTIMIFSLGLLTGIGSVYNTYVYNSAVTDDTSVLRELLGVLTHDPKLAAMKVVLPILFLYLLLRKDTKNACGITKAENVKIDELDHLV